MELKEWEVLEEICHIGFHGLDVELEWEKGSKGEVGLERDVMRVGLMEGCSCAATDCCLLLCLEVSESSLDLEFPLIWPFCLEELEVVEVNVHNTAIDCRSVDVNDVGDLCNQWTFGLLG